MDTSRHPEKAPQRPHINLLDMRAAASRAVANVSDATESVSTDKLERQGVQNVRVLSESKLQDLLFEMVEERVRAALEDGIAEDADDSTSTFDARAAVEREEDRARIRTELSEAYRRTWKEYRSRNAERLAVLEGRLLRTQERFTHLEELVARLFDGVALEELGED